MEPRVVRRTTITEPGEVPTVAVPTTAVPMDGAFSAPVVQEPVPVAATVPVTSMPPAMPPAVAVPVEPSVHEHVVVDSRRRISPSAVVATIAAIVLMLWGAIVVARAGLSGGLETPVVEVTGYTATAVLGLIVLGGGFLLLLAGLAQSRAAIVFLSIVMAVGAATLVIEPTTAQNTLAAERDFGVAALIVLGITAVVALVTPDVDRIARRERIA